MQQRASFVSLGDGNDADAQIRAISQIKQDLEQFDFLTASIVGILDGFESKLEQLESIMMPVHQQTNSLITAQRNINTCIKKVEDITRHHVTAEKPDSEIEKMNIRDDLHGYLEWFRQVTEARKFFKSNSEMQGSDKFYKKMKALSKKAGEDCVQELKHLLTQQHAKEGSPSPLVGTHNGDVWSISPTGPVNAATLAVPTLLTHQPNHPNVNEGDCISEEDIEKLSAIATELDRSGNREVMLHEIATFRSGYCFRALKKEWEKDKNSDDRKMGNTDAARRYQRGQHVNVLLITLSAHLFQSERRLIQRIQANTNMPEAEIAKCFQATVQNPLDFLTSKLDKRLKETGANKVLILLDVLDTLKVKFPDFQAALSLNTELLRRISIIEDNTEMAFLKALQEYHAEITQYQGEKLKDGTIISLVVETGSYLKQIYYFESTFQTLTAHEMPYHEHVTAQRGADSNSTNGSQAPDQSLKRNASRARGPRGLRGVVTEGHLQPLTTWILLALLDKIERIQKSYTRQTLAAIFGMNNSHHIYKLCRKGELRMPASFVTELDSKVKDMKKKYADATWSKLIPYLDVQDAQRQVEKVKKSKDQMSSVSQHIKSVFKNINQICEAAYHDQIKFSIPDSDLRSQVRAENVSNIIPKYELLLSVLSGLNYSNNKAKYQKYSVEQLEKMLNGFFGES